jgi:cyclopropane fatty-acyl-phospholipid synthase-like methyltransferase
MSRNEFYNLWYTLRRPQWDTGQSPKELLDFIQIHPPGRALDLGCGTGTSVITLTLAGWQATGVDFAPQAIKLAREKTREVGVTAQYRVGDVTKVRFPPASFDLILDIGCFQGLEQRHENYIRNVQKWLAPGGVFLLYSLLRKPDIPEFGITEAEIEKFSPLTLRKRTDGFNQGPVTRASVWLELVKEK